MLIMSIAAGKAFTFHDFKVGVSRAKFGEVLRDMWGVFLKDLKLIKPRKRGGPRHEVIELNYGQDMELIDFKRESAYNEIMMQKNTLKNSLIVNYH